MRFATIFLATAAVVLAQDTVSATGAACEPHGDHWHCPAGVPEPTTPPAAEPAETGASASRTVVVSTTGSAEAGATACEPHGDHWHCPSGVAEPTTPPAATQTGDHDEHDHDEHDDDHDHEATAATCEPHGDHWHCPSGVAEPTAPPAASITTTSSGDAAPAESAAATSSQFDGSAGTGAGPMGPFPAAVVGLLGMLFA